MLSKTVGLEPWNDVKRRIEKVNLGQRDATALRLNSRL